MSSKRTRRQRASLFALQGGLCYWCKQPMLLVETHNPKVKLVPPNICTLDHLDPRWSPYRGEFNGVRRRVAACAKCNNERDAESHKKLPKEVLRCTTGGTPATILAKRHKDLVAAAYPFIALAEL